MRSNHHLSALCVLLCLSAACAPEQSATTSQALTSSQPSPALPNQSSDEIPIKPAQPMPIMEVLSPDATALAAHPTIEPPTALPIAQRERLMTSPLPTLIPGALDAAQLAAAIVTTGPHWYALTTTHDGVTVYIQGTRTSMEHPQLELDEAGDAVAKKPYTISRTHQITTLSFERFGLGYAIDIECAKPEADTRCTEQDYALSLHDSLTLLATPRQGGVQ